MPQVDKRPKTLRPYLFHSVNLEWSDNDEQATADCPFCGREGKFSVNIESGLWRCLVCALGSAKGGGNAFVFLRLFWAECDAQTSDYSAIQMDRGILFPETLIEWGVVQSYLGDCWLVPGYNVDGKLCQLYRYAQTAKGMQLLCTSALDHQIMGRNLWNKDASIVYLCEGPWDAMVLWETLKHTKQTEEGNI